MMVLHDPVEDGVGDSGVLDAFMMPPYLTA